MLPAALGIFFVSGFAALVYQVVWQRTLVIFSGADVYAATIVVAAFMAGLGCGSLGGGYLADRISRMRALGLFAMAELAIAVFGFASPWLFYSVLYERVGQMGLGLPTTAGLLFVALLWPTFFMGASLPLLARGLTRNIASAGSTVGWLYALNTLGAAIGALVTTWWLLPQTGLDGVARLAAFLNLGCAAAAVPLAWAGRAHGDAAPTASVPEAPAPRAIQTLNFPVWAALFALAGFVALSLEIVWFRLLGVMLKGTAFTFGTLLGVYLTGLGLGATIGSSVARRVRRPALGFFLLQAGAGVYAAASLTLLVSGLGDADSLEWFRTYFGQYNSIDIRRAIGQLANGGWPADFFRLYFLLPLALIGPATLLNGCSFPLLQKVVQNDLRFIGQRVGILLASNIVGSTLGAFVTGWMLLGWLGSAGTVTFVLGLGAVFAALAVWQIVAACARPVKILAYAGTAGLFVALLSAVPRAPLLWSRLHGTGPRFIIFAEDGSGLSVLRAERDFSNVVVFVNGYGWSWIPYGGIHSVLGALPAFIHPGPKDAALIGLGSGDTLYAMAGRGELERIVAIEIIGSQLGTLRELAEEQRSPAVLALLADPRVEHLSGDGRLYLRHAKRQYDLIEADALEPTSAYSGNLYSDAYFRLLLEHLKPGGLAVTWAPTERVARTFLRVFPHVRYHEDMQIMMGSNAPIPLDPDAILRRLAEPAVTEHFAVAGIDIRELMAPLMSGWQTFDPSYDRSNLDDINTDLHPKDEFDILPRPRAERAIAPSAETRPR